jgi:uncharacterized membrane protein
MLVVRYLVLAAQVVWLGGMVTLELIVGPASCRVLQAADPHHGRLLAGMLIGDIFRQFHLVAYLCGAVVVAGMFVMKFVGPPPSAFLLRLALIAAMLGSAFYTGVPVSRELSQLQASVPGPAAQFDTADPRQARIDTLRRTSSTFMTVNLALGLFSLFWYARE